MTQVIAIPLRDREADPLREQLAKHARRGAVDGADMSSVGPLGVVLTGEEGDGGWLLAGTLTQDALVRPPTTCSPVRLRGRRPVAATAAVIRTEGLTKRFGRITAVDAVDLDVREGDVYGFLGANGSGKTTTVRMLLGLVLATSGEIELLGRADAARAGATVLPQVGALVEGPAAYPHLSGRRNLALFDAMGPAAIARRPARRGSTRRSTRSGWPASTSGRCGRTRWACGSGSGSPAPCCAGRGCWSSTSRRTGSTRRASARSASCCSTSTASGTTVFLSSHLLAEVEQLCTRVGVLDRGRLVLQDELATLQQPTGRVEVRTPDVERVRALLDGEVEQYDGDAAAGPRRRPGRRSTRGWSRPASRVHRAGAPSAARSRTSSLGGDRRPARDRLGAPS